YLEEQLRQPKYEIHGFEPATIITQSVADQPLAWRDQALGFLFAATPAKDQGTFDLSNWASDSEEFKAKLVSALWKDLDPLITALLDKLASYPADRPPAFFADL